MMKPAKKGEFGDFQTPLPLAQEIAAFLKDNGETPDTIVEPTCGSGNFIVAAIEAFPEVRAFYGFDISPEYVSVLNKKLQKRNVPNYHVECKNFFQVNWKDFFATLTKDMLIIGNPPWVTNSALGALGSNNLPEKSNFQRHNGFAAKTGKANFDISEWMLIKLMESLNGRIASVAMLCKTATARKSLRHAWLNQLNIGQCSIHLIDAQKHFGVSVDACLFVFKTGIIKSKPVASLHSGLSLKHKLSTLGLVGKELVADIEGYQQLRDLDGRSYYIWRSGVKHDAASVMELKGNGGHYINGKHEECDIESTYVFPLFKSSDIATGRAIPKKHVLLTQRKPSDDTSEIERRAPKTWYYLTKNADILDNRKSIIYAKRPRFSIFGVGDYTFSPWKVAISGLYKNCLFAVVGEYQKKPIVLDDTCYFIPCLTEREAHFICALLNSEICQRFLRTLVFFDAKRPITIDILNRIDLNRVAERLKKENEAKRYLSLAAEFEDRQPLLVFEEQEKYTSGDSKQRRKRMQ